MRSWAVVVAAGRGERFGGAKQFAPLRGRPVLAWTLERLAACPEVAGVVVVLPADPPWLPPAELRGRALRRARGGATRALSVRAGLAALPEELPAEATVLVHDAVRPCIEPVLVARLMAEAGADPAGGLLAVPVRDSLKRGEDGRVAGAVSRAALWRAQTPQLFARGLLERALADPGAEHCGDEAEAVERLGLRPRLVLGSERNLKITVPEDLELAALVLAAQEGG